MKAFLSRLQAVDTPPKESPSEVLDQTQTQAAPVFDENVLQSLQDVAAGLQNFVGTFRSLELEGFESVPTELEKLVSSIVQAVKVLRSTQAMQQTLESVRGQVDVRAAALLEKLIGILHGAGYSKVSSPDEGLSVVQGVFQRLTTIARSQDTTISQILGRASLFILATKKCPGCGDLGRESDNFCSNCGTKFQHEEMPMWIAPTSSVKDEQAEQATPVPLPRAPAAPITFVASSGDGKFKVCPNCQAKNLPSRTICINCHQPL